MRAVTALPSDATPAGMVKAIVLLAKLTLLAVDVKGTNTPKTLGAPVKVMSGRARDPAIPSPVIEMPVIVVGLVQPETGAKVKITLASV